MSAAKSSPNATLSHTEPYAIKLEGTGGKLPEWGVLVWGMLCMVVGAGSCEMARWRRTLSSGQLLRTNNNSIF